MGEDALEEEVARLDDAPREPHRLGRLAPDASHARVELQVNRGGDPQSGRHLRHLVDGVGVHDREGEVGTQRGFDLLGERVGELEDRERNACFPQFDPLGDRRDPEPVGRPGALDHSRDLDRAVAVGVRRDGREDRPVPYPIAHPGEVLADRCQIDDGVGGVEHASSLAVGTFQSQCSPRASAPHSQCCTTCAPTYGDVAKANRAP